MSAKELRDQLRELRKEAVKPVSKMRKEDVSKEIEKLRELRGDTAPVASTPMGPIKASKAAAETIKEAKRTEFPVEPVAEKKKTGKAIPAGKKSAPAGAAEGGKKKSKLERMLALIDEMSDAE
jgi:hypothetical protein